MPTKPSKQASIVIITLIIIGVFSIFWWSVIGEWSVHRAVLLASLALAAFIVGSLIGFFFSSYGKDESATIGKIRDWLIGGIVALTVVKASSIKDLLIYFAYNPAGTGDPARGEFALAIGTAIFYTGLGFFFMYFERELFFNVLLAESRAQREKLEGSQETGKVIQHFLLRLPASMLTGVRFCDEIEDSGQA